MKGRTAISSKPETSRTKKACQDIAVIRRSILHLLSSFAVTIGLGCFTLLALGWTEVPGALGVGVFLLLLDTLKERICHDNSIGVADNNIKTTGTVQPTCFWKVAFSFCHQEH